MRIAITLLFIAGLIIARAQEAPTPIPPPLLPRTIPIRFVPPPLEGTISLGIYDASGKLVRVLHREDTIADFTAGHDALETSWDGNDDKGTPLPNAKYSARGFLVGDLKVEGVDYFFNDWVTDETSPHVAHISRIEMNDGQLQLHAFTAGEKEITALYNFATEKLSVTDAPQIAPLPNESLSMEKLGGLIDPIASSLGKDGTIWTISHVNKESSETVIEQLSVPPEAEKNSKTYTVLRKLPISPNDPQPIGIAASRSEERIFLLEQGPDLQRVRSLTLVATNPDATGKEQSISDWKVDFEKKIIAHQNFSLEKEKPVVTSGAAPPPATLLQKLRPNPLKRDQPDKVELAVGFDGDGSYLKTADGLPLRTISDTPNLSRALLAPHGDNAIDVFQDDSAVVEQFRVSQLDQMMAFDCGDFELK